MPPSPASEAPTVPPTAGEDEQATLPPLRDRPSDTPESWEVIRYFGDYELLEEIARGGMGVVYKARQRNLNRIVALKMILAGQLAGEEEISRFHTEAQAAANLDHPGIVPIFEVGEHDSQHYFSMGFVQGDSLKDRLAQGPLAPKEAASLVQRIAQAVAYAHQKGVIHRDLKPGNVLLDENGQPRITDFGLAKRIEADSGLTATGQILGTPSYMPPEQASGDSEITPAADVYALGAVLYACLAGRPPFQAENAVQTMMQVLEKSPVRPSLLNPSIPKYVETICLKCLEKQPAHRYVDAQALADDLGRFVRDEPIAARRIGVVEKTGRGLYKHRRSVAAVCAAAAIGALAIAAVTILPQRYRESRLGDVRFTTSHTPLYGVITDKSGETNLGPIALPMSNAVSLLRGSYEIALRGSGRREETYKFYTWRGGHLIFDVGEDQQLWAPIHVRGDEHYELLPFDDAHDILPIDAQRLVRISGANGQQMWTTHVDPAKWESLSSLEDFDWAEWWRQPDRQRPHIVRPARDVDGDGFADIVVFQPGDEHAFVFAGRAGDVRVVPRNPQWQDRERSPIAKFKKLTGRGRDLPQWRPEWAYQADADFDGDGVNDTFWFEADKQRQQFGSGTLHVHKGMAEAVWRRGGEPRITGDLNGDGIRDYLDYLSTLTRDDQMVLAISGADGNMLWTTTDFGLFSPPKEMRDFDGDGADDLISISSTNIPIGAVYVISGKTGKPVWHKRGPDERPSYFRRVVNLDGDARPEIFVDTSLNMTTGSASDTQPRYRLTLLNHLGDDLWTHAWSLDKPGKRAVPAAHYSLAATAHLNNDAVLDVVVAYEAPVVDAEASDFAEADEHLQLRAVNGANGHLLWERPFNHKVAYVHPVAINLSGNSTDSCDLIVTLETPNYSARKNDYEGPMRLDGETGKTLWEWRKEDQEQLGEFLSEVEVPHWGPRTNPADTVLIADDKLLLLDADGRVTSSRRYNHERGAPVEIALPNDEVLEFFVRSLAVDAEKLPDSWYSRVTQQQAGAVSLSLLAARNRSGEIIWTQIFASDLTQIASDGVVDFRGEPLVLVQEDTAMWGVSTICGALRWKWDGGSAPLPVVLNEGDAKRRPLLASIAEKGGTICREAFLVDSQGRFVGSENASATLNEDCVASPLPKILHDAIDREISQFERPDPP